MIKYSLICDASHSFEGWFSNSADFDKQSKKRLLECPVCGSAKVEKALMAPAIARKGSLSVSSAKEEKLAAYRKELNEAARKAKAYVEKNFDNVGKKFPEEARKIHYGETKERGIYGEAEPQEVKELIEEGIEVAPVPVPVEEPAEAKKKMN
jgi:hypothetical protein